MSEINQISVEALGHTFNIMPGVGYSLSDDGTFAIQWQDKSVYTYRVVSMYDDMSYEVNLISEQDCTADLTSFRPFFPDADGYTVPFDCDDDDGDDFEPDGDCYDDREYDDFEPEPFEEDWATDHDMEPMDFEPPQHEYDDGDF